MSTKKSRILCPACQGKGHVLYGANSLLALISVVCIPLLFFERNDPGGYTRIECERCDGLGHVDV